MHLILWQVSFGKYVSCGNISQSSSHSPLSCLIIVWFGQFLYLSHTSAHFDVLYTWDYSVRPWITKRVNETWSVWTLNWQGRVYTSWGCAQARRVSQSWSPTVPCNMNSSARETWASAQACSCSVKTFPTRFFTHLSLIFFTGPHPSQTVQGHPSVHSLENVFEGVKLTCHKSGSCAEADPPGWDLPVSQCSSQGWLCGTFPILRNSEGTGLNPPPTPSQIK